MMEHYFATCPRGLEGVLNEELATLGANDISAVEGGVQCTGNAALSYAINLESRVASRVLWRLAHARYLSEQDIYEAVRALAWTDWFTVDQSLRVDVSAIRSPVKSLEFVTLRVKDAVCDVFRAACGSRPDVDTRAPDVRIQVFLSATHFTLYLDTSGEPLFKRGYRKSTGEAPLRENLAAGILRLTGWAPGTPLLDPMCGSGTFLAEAAMMAIDRAPGLTRSFGFEKLKTFEAKTWQKMKAAAEARVTKPEQLAVFGSDRYADTLKLARTNLAALGVESLVSLKQADVLEMPPPASSGILVTNPPYGVRQHDLSALAQLYPKLGDALKKRYANWTAFVFTGDLRVAKLIGLSPSRRTPLFNGALECRLFEFRIVAGSMRNKARNV